jgi:hypothetical protein
LFIELNLEELKKKDEDEKENEDKNEKENEDKDEDEQVSESEDNDEKEILKSGGNRDDINDNKGMSLVLSSEYSDHTKDIKHRILLFAQSREMLNIIESKLLKEVSLINANF